MADSDPLIKPPHQPPTRAMHASIPRPASNCMFALGTLRSAIGVGCLLAPALTCQAFLVDIGSNGPGMMLTRLVGARELALGGLLLYMRNAPAAGLRHVLIANIATDSMDIVSCVLAEVTGAVGWETAAIFGGGAVAFVGLGLMGLREL